MPDSSDIFFLCVERRLAHPSMSYIILLVIYMLWRLVLKVGPQAWLPHVWGPEIITTAVIVDLQLGDVSGA